jgi:hypothetical protein
VFSCLGRLGCLLILVVLGAFAFLTRDRWLPRITGERAPEPPTWEAVSEPGARKAENALASLNRPNGPAYVTLSAAELAGLMVQSAGYRLPATLDSVQAAIEDETVRVRALVKLDDIKGLDALGPLSGLLDKQERIEFTGTLGVIRPGLGEFRVATVKVADLALPRAAIPRLLARLDKSVRPEGVAPDGIAITIPESIGDVRVARGQVTLYRRTK